MSIRADVRLAGRLAVLNVGSLALAATGDPVARLTVPPWRRAPYPLYARLRSRGAPFRSRAGVVAVAGHRLCDQVLRDRRFGVRTVDGRIPFAATDPLHAPEGVSRPTDPMDPMDLSLLGLDGADHTRLRRLAAPAFAARRIHAYGDTVERVAARLLDRLDPDGPFDLMEAFATPLPVAVITEILGVPDADATRFAAWGRLAGSALDGVRSVRQAHALTAATAQMRELFVGLVERRRADPGPDLVSRLVGAMDAGELTVDELLGLAQLMLVAGFETTRNLIGNGVSALFTHPDQHRALCARPELADVAVEETLRYDPPVQLTARVAHEPVRLDDVLVATDEVVLVLLGSAGRDPEVHPDPDRFDIVGTHVREHLAFSGGAHYCLGAPLARREATTALRMLAERFPTLRPAGRAVPAGSTVLHGFRRLPVQV